MGWSRDMVTFPGFCARVWAGGDGVFAGVVCAPTTSKHGHTVSKSGRHRRRKRMADSLRQQGNTRMGVPRPARKRGDGYAGGARAGTFRAAFLTGKLRACVSGAVPVGSRTKARALTGAGSMA